MSEHSSHIIKAGYDKDSSFYKAKRLINQRKYSEAVLYLKIASQLGNAEAMYQYGQLFLLGLGVEKNSSHLMYCMEKSAELNNADAIWFLTDVYLTGKYGEDKNISKAYSYFLRLPETYVSQKGDNAANIEKIFINCEVISDDVDAVGELMTKSGKTNQVDWKSSESKSTAFEEEYANLKEFYHNAEDVLSEYKNSRETLPEKDYIDESVWMGIVARIKKRNEDIDEQVKRIEKILPSPYVRRMRLKFNEDYNDIEDIYVGKENLKGLNGKDLVYSWFSPIGNKIYDDVHTHWEIKGNAVDLLMKREIYIDSQKLKTVRDTYNADGVKVVVSDPYLLKLIEDRIKIGKPTDIIATIQNNQNQIIISNANKNLIMQGCAGCGKTMILFHRIKYVVGNNIKTPLNICVLTPSERFNEFIKPLMSDLNLNNIRVYSVAVFYKNLIDKYYKNSDVKFSSLFYKNGITDKAVRLADDNDLPDSIVNCYYSKEFSDKIYSLRKVKLNPISKESFNSLKKINEKGEIDILEGLLGADEKAILPQYERKAGVIHKCELFALCMFLFKRCGNTVYKREGLSTEKISFDVNLLLVDEAQDLSVSEYLLVNSFFKGKTVVNLFGDTDQCVTQYGIENWNELNKIFGDVDFYTYNKNYRNSSEVIEFINKNCGKGIENIGLKGNLPVTHLELKMLPLTYGIDKHKRKAIICSNKTKKQLISGDKLNKCNILSVKEAKGQEFDSVYVLDKDLSDNEKYIAYSRAISNLKIVDFYDVGDVQYENTPF